MQAEYNVETITDDGGGGDGGGDGGSGKKNQFQACKRQLGPLMRAYRQTRG